VFRKQKTETKLKAMETTNNARKKEKWKPKRNGDLIGNKGADRFRTNF